MRPHTTDKERLFPAPIASLFTRSSLRYLWLALSLAVAAACHAGEPVRAPGASPDSQRQIANLHSFAKLYGVVRWFHPSDAAAAIDWDRYAVDGVRRVVGARDAGALRGPSRN